MPGDVLAPGRKTLRWGSVIKRFEGVVTWVSDDRREFDADLKDAEGNEYRASEIWSVPVPGYERIRLEPGRAFVWEIVLRFGCDPTSRFTFLPGGIKNAE